MKQEIKDIMDRLLKRHKELGISDQIDYEKSYLYSIITHSTAIEDSTVTEVEAQLLFDGGITAKGKTAYPNGGFPFWMLLVCSTTKTIIPRTETIGSI